MCVNEGKFESESVHRSFGDQHMQDDDFFRSWVIDRHKDALRDGFKKCWKRFSDDKNKDDYYAYKHPDGMAGEHYQNYVEARVVAELALEFYEKIEASFGEPNKRQKK